MSSHHWPDNRFKLDRYITLQYIIYGPIVDSMLALNAVSKAELPLLKSILGVRPAHLSLIELVYYAEYTFNLSALSDTVMLLSCAIALKTSLWSALLIAIISQPLRFALIFLFMGIRKASSFTQNLKTKHKPLVWLLSGLLVLAFILLSLRLTIASGNLPAIQSFNLNSLGTHLINNLKTIDFTSLSLYSWYPGTMVIQIALHADFLALLKLILTIVFLSALGYILAILNARQEQQHVATEITPLLTDGVLLQQYRHKLGLTYTYLKTLFLNPKFTRGKTFIEILVFTILLLAIVTRFSDQVSRQALLFIGFFALLFSNRASFKLDSPLVFSLAELQAFSNIPLKTLLGHKVLAAWLAHYLEIAAVLMLSCFCLNNGQAFLTLWLWVLLLLVGKTCLIPWGSSCLVGLSTSNQPNNKVTAKSTIYLHRLSTTAPLFLVLLVLYNPRSLSTLTFLGTMLAI
ncbi:hypothetical protein JCM14202_1246 [Agrilactobacillus composti DSM 18527 = JCM 14202]|uniref:hypothetical protein n=1 Tax=Agrilactobacillus composti TaxID=398555 RepID=UPI00042DE71C|nr:hypothetical protein [Agrilactobacillus composti]GAF39384.1 hypothetical protein JCM14202_1246 [Agrilactobacillus composti DSM 18527 = JCM 14202]